VDHARLSNDLGIVYHDRFRITGAAPDLETAIQQYHAALDCTATDHPGRAARLHILGTGYHDAYHEMGETASRIFDQIR
jgi:predicted TPR repeat methyltransferase